MNPTILDDEAAVQHLLSILRDRETTSAEFRARTDSLAALVIAAALRDAPFSNISIETPLERVDVRRINEARVIGVPILRAGLGMERAFSRLLPAAPIYHIGLKRDEGTFIPNYYYDSFPGNLTGKTAFLLDPMLATGGSAIAAAKRISALNPEKIVYCGIIGAPEGVGALSAAFPTMDIFLSTLDDHLDETAYIRPGLGDAGDRYYGTL